MNPTLSWLCPATSRVAPRARGGRRSTQPAVAPATWHYRPPSTRGRERDQSVGSARGAKSVRGASSGGRSSSWGLSPRRFGALDVLASLFACTKGFLDFPERGLRPASRPEASEDRGLRDRRRRRGDATESGRGEEGGDVQSGRHVRRSCVRPRLCDRQARAAERGERGLRGPRRGEDWCRAPSRAETGRCWRVLACAGVCWRGAHGPMGRGPKRLPGAGLSRLG